ncbi:MAG: tetratricopeptide repeat protein [Verrucomicrobiales bacterium]|nr:tetratricopeptide repeat protein [Verrucomicrobiales bacterium]
MASDAENAAHRQNRIFDHLVDAGQWDRVIEMGPQLLGDDPENAYIHNMMAVAALETGDYRLADHHSAMSVRLEPEEALPHRLRARYYRSINRILLAKGCILEALRIDPDDASVWSEYGWNCYERGDLHTARKACATARSLAPEELNIELLETAVEGAVDAPDRLSAYDQIEAYQKSLRLDPECAATYYNIGLIWLDLLDDGKNAAEWFRKAVTLEPRNRDFQKALEKAVSRCDPVLRVIHFPIHLIKRGGLWIESFRAKHPLAIAAGLPLLALGACVAIVPAAIWMAFLYLPGQLYRWLAHAEIVQKATGGERPRNGIYRLPLWFRSALFFLISLPFCYVVFLMFTEPEAKKHMDKVIGGGMIAGMVIGLWISAKKRKN